MFECHLWVNLFPDWSDVGTAPIDLYMESKRKRLRKILAQLEVPGLCRSLINSEMGDQLIINTARTTSPAYKQGLLALLEWIAAELPSSWGLMYSIEDEVSTEAEASNGYDVHVLRKGKIENYPDPFLSPLRLKADSPVDLE